MNVRGAISRGLAGACALGLAGPTTPAAAAPAECLTSTTDRPTAGIATSGSAIGRGLFVTYSDGGTVFEAGTIKPPDIAAPLAQASVDRTGLGVATAAPVHSAWLSELGGAKVSGRPPQQQRQTTGGGACARLSDGPLAEAAATGASLSPGMSVRLGEVRATTGPKAGGFKALSTVVMTDVRIGDLRIEQIVLHALAVADGADGGTEIRSMVSGITLGEQRFVIDEAGLDPALLPAPDLEVLRGAGIEVLSGGSTEHRARGTTSIARATGPVLRITSPDRRVMTVVLGQATALAERG